VGRWLSTEPLAEKYAHLSPYQYAANNPITSLDKDGREIVLSATAVYVGGAVAIAVTGHLVSMATNPSYRKAYNEGSRTLANVATDAANSSLAVVGSFFQSLFSKKAAPEANEGNAPQHGSADHDAAVNQAVGGAKAQGHVDNRKNQAQVNAEGEKVGKNRPDQQSIDKEGNRHITEVDRTEKASKKHVETVKKNDPNAIIHVIILKSMVIP